MNARRIHIDRGADATRSSQRQSLGEQRFAGRKNVEAVFGKVVEHGLGVVPVAR